MRSPAPLPLLLRSLPPHAQLQQWRPPRTSPSPLTPLFNAVRARFRLLSFSSKLTTHHLKGRQQQKREALANEIMGSGRRKSAPGAAAQNNSSNNRKGAAGGSLASRMGVTKVRWGIALRPMPKIANPSTLCDSTPPLLQSQTSTTHAGATTFTI